MKHRFIIAVIIGLLGASCSGDGGVSTTQAVVTTSEPASVVTAPVYRISVTVAYDETEESVSASEYRLIYDLTKELEVGSSATFDVVEGAVHWNVRCDGEDADGFSSRAELVIPSSVDEIDGNLVDEFPDGRWLEPAALSLHELDGDLWVIHRFPAAVSLGEAVVCPGESEVASSFVPSVGSGWMTVRAINVDGAPLSRADLRNFEIGSFPTTYFTHELSQIDQGSGWVIGIVQPGDVENGPVPLRMRDRSNDAERTYRFAVDGVIELVG